MKGFLNTMVYVSDFFDRELFEIMAWGKNSQQAC